MKNDIKCMFLVLTALRSLVGVGVVKGTNLNTTFTVSMPTW